MSYGQALPDSIEHRSRTARGNKKAAVMLWPVVVSQCMPLLAVALALAINSFPFASRALAHRRRMCAQQVPHVRLASGLDPTTFAC